MALVKGTNGKDTLTDKSRDFESDIYGYGGDDVLYGLGGKDYIYGGLGSDKLYGGDGDDWLHGGAGADRLDGGKGNNGAAYSDATSAVVVSLDGSLKAKGDAIGDSFFSIQKLAGSNRFNDILSGNRFDNYISGKGGDDRLYGRSGDDWINGGKGADLIDGGTGIDGVSYYFGTGTRVALDGSFASSSEARGDRFVSIENLEGSEEGSDTLAGNSSANSIWGYDGSDLIFGRSGNDELFGGNSDDALKGESGNDWLHGESGEDTLDGGAGRDGASYYDSTGVTVSLDGSLQATGEAYGDTFVSIEKLSGSGTKADTLGGNEFDNFIYSHGGNDKLYGRAGDDNLGGGTGADFLDGGDGQDITSYYYGPAVIVSLDASLVATGEARGDRFVSIEDLEGSDTGADTLAGDAEINYIYGQGGNDKIYGRAGNDDLWGNEGNDVLIGEAGDDYLEGGIGADRLFGGSGMDVADYYDSKTGVTRSLDGSLKATGFAVGDVFSSIEGLAGSNTGADKLNGNSANNLLRGNGGNDVLNGQGGNDRINGGEGTDTLTGGAGSDTFYFRFTTEDADKITDFTVGDKIELRVSGFTALAIGALAEEQFVNGAGHAAATDLIRVLFDTSSNTLWYDADGNGTEAAIRLATFTNGYQALAAADFILTD
jgi:Ca2+-binding RTX toxin-like protein